MLFTDLVPKYKGLHFDHMYLYIIIIYNNMVVSLRVVLYTISTRAIVPLSLPPFWARVSSWSLFRLFAGSTRLDVSKLFFFCAFFCSFFYSSSWSSSSCFDEFSLMLFGHGLKQGKCGRVNKVLEKKSWICIFT